MVCKHWKSCTRLGTHSKVTIPDYHSLEEFLITKTYVDWWIGVCNLEKTPPPPHDSSRQIPSKSLESRIYKIDPSVSTKKNVGDNIEGEFSITKTYVDWWIGVCNLEKTPPPPSS